MAAPIFYRPPQVNQNLMCRHKVRYDTEKDAKTANSGFRAYHCPYCGKWHLTSRVVK